MSILQWKNRIVGGVLAVCLGVAGAGSVYGENSLGNVREESSLQPIGDETGNLLLKSDGYYCLQANGSQHTKPGIHYFDHVVMDGVIFDGFYYHDESGKFTAGNPHMVFVNNLRITLSDGDAYNFNGGYMVNNMGRLSAAPQVRYMEQLVLNNVTYDGYYYFNEFGRMVTEPGVYEVHNAANGRVFDGYYYFGGANASLVTEAGETPEGQKYDENGLVIVPEELPENLSPEDTVAGMTENFEGEWAVYALNLEDGEKLEVNNHSMYSASVIKAFVMAKTFEDMEDVLRREGELMNRDPESGEVQNKVDQLLDAMITVSDNESFNELVRLQSDKHSFVEGAEAMNQYLEENGYEDTRVVHTLSPSSSASEGLSEDGVNATSVLDCGRLLERIYRRECVSATASVKMINLLLDQKTTYKIPAGVPDGIVTASKSGENDQTQNDIAIIFGEKNDYILCVMCNDYRIEGDAISGIQEISEYVYQWMNKES